MNCGNAIYFIGYIDYITEADEAILIGSTVSAAALLIIAIILIVFCCKRKCGNTSNEDFKGDREQGGLNAENEPVVDIDDEADYRDFPVVSSVKKDDGASMYYPTTMPYDDNVNDVNRSGAVFSRGFVLPRPNLYDNVKDVNMNGVAFSRGFVLPRPNLYDNNPYHQPFPRIQRD